MASKVPVAPHAAGRQEPDPPALVDLEVGDRATIVAVSADEAVRERLLDLGFVPGTTITLVRRAPLGDPCVYALRGVQMCLRAAEASRISVHPASTPGA